MHKAVYSLVAVPPQSHVVLQIYTRASSLSTTVKHRGDNLLGVTVLSKLFVGSAVQILDFNFSSGSVEFFYLARRPGGSKIALWSDRCHCLLGLSDPPVTES